MKRMNNEKGFTLVELMIVVAIIGILAAIAIPQFNQYRIRGFNSSALSDTKNAYTSEAALFSTWQKYGVSFTVAAAGPFAVPAAVPAAGVCVGGDAMGDGIVTADNAGTPQGQGISVGNGVALIADTSNAPAAGVGTAPAFQAAGKHNNGDTTYAVDSDSTNTYQNSVLIAVGTPIAALPAFTGGAGGNVVNEDNIQGTAGWTVK